MWNDSNYSNATGKMTYEQFAFYADQMGVDQAVWVAKWFGIALHTVKSFVRLYGIPKK